MRRVLGGLAGGTLGLFAAYGAGFVVPETPYEVVLGWMLWSGLGGALIGALLARR